MNAMNKMFLPLIILLLSACTKDKEKPGNTSSNPPGSSDNKDISLTLYCGRGQDKIEPVLKAFEKETGIQLKIEYKKSPELAALLATEGERSPADVFISQDLNSMLQVNDQNMLLPLGEGVLEGIDAKYYAAGKHFTGLTGRMRTVIYNTESVDPATLPSSIDGYTDPKYKGKIGWAPKNGSFQTFLAVMLNNWGKPRTLAWLEAMQANEPRVYPKNTPIVEAAGKGEIEVGFVNHYYLYKLKEKFGNKLKAENHYLEAGDPGAYLMMSCAGILKTSKNKAAAEQLIQYLLNEASQSWFVKHNFEVPLRVGIPPYTGMPAVQPTLDLSKMKQSEEVKNLLREAEIL